MDLVVTSESGHVDLCSKPEARNKLVSIVVKNDVGHLVKSLLIETTFVVSVMM